MSTELAILPKTDISPVSEAINHAREALARIESAAEAKDFIENALTAEAHYKRLVGRVWWATDAYRETALVRLLAQRKVGEIRALTPRRSGTGSYGVKVDWDEAKRLFEAGMTLTAIAKQMGVALATISRAKHMNWTRPARVPGKVDFDRELGISTHEAVFWEALAALNVDTIERCLREAVESNGPVSAMKICGAAGGKVPYPPGRTSAAFRAKYNERRREERRKASDGARALLAQERLREARARGDALGRAYTALRADLLPELQAAYDMARTHQRTLLSEALTAAETVETSLAEAMAAAYAIEDRLGKAMRT